MLLLLLRVFLLSLVCGHGLRQTHSFKTNRESMAVADQSLDVIQGWGEAFLPRRVSGTNFFFSFLYSLVFVLFWFIVFCFCFLCDCFELTYYEVLV